MLYLYAFSSLDYTEICQNPTTLMVFFKYILKFKCFIVVILFFGKTPPQIIAFLYVTKIKN